MGLDLTKVTKAAIKEDGSLITSFIDFETDELRLKSKQALDSEQAIMAQELMATPKYEQLAKETKSLTASGYTVMFELVSPANRIVLEYPETELRVIGVRSMGYGHELLKEDVEAYPAIHSLWVHEHIPETPEVFVKFIPEMTGIEGYVLTMEDGLMVKVKTEWYKTLHHLKDSVDSVKRLFEAIIDERVDDVKAMFATDSFTINRIAEMEAKVIPVFNHMIARVEKFYEENKTATRKDYAIKGQSELGQFFSLGMAKYLSSMGIKEEPNYKEFAKKYREEIFGLKEPETVEE
jgi:T4 RnlA family RNA ligase